MATKKKCLICICLTAAFLIGCNPPKPLVVTEHMGPGIVRTVEYWGEGDHSQIAHNRLVIETGDHLLRQFDQLCEHRIAAWQGMEFKDMLFQHNGEWDCYHIIAFVK